MSLAAGPKRRLVGQECSNGYGSAGEREALTAHVPCEGAADMNVTVTNSSYEGPRPVRAGDESDDEDYFTVDDAIEHIGFGKFQVGLSVFAGMIWMVDAMEVMIMSIISPAARCAFDLHDVEVAMITTAVFIGIFIGAPIWGYLMDKYGRHKCLLLSSLLIGVYGLASAFSPNYFWLLTLRFMVGFNLAATPQAMTYYSEFLPSSIRGTCVVFIEVFWSIGTIFETALAMGVMPTLGWRYLLGFSSLPVMFSCIVFFFFPESPHFLVTSGKNEAALKVLKRVARANKKSLPAGTLVSAVEKARRDKLKESISDDDGDSTTSVEASSADSPLPAGVADPRSELKGFEQSDAEDSNPLIHEIDLGSAASPVHVSLISDGKNEGKNAGFMGLFSSRKVGLSTILLGFIWFTLAFVYYGVSLMTVEVLSVDLVVNGTCINSLDTEGASSCTLSRAKYITNLWTTAAEFPGLVITFLLMYFLSRRATIRIEFALVTVFYSLLLICDVPRIATLMFIFGVRALITGAFQAVYVYTPEMYPTAIRATGLSFCSAISRIGGIATPFVAEVVLRHSLIAGKLIYTTVAGIGFLAAVLLPIETKGRALD